MAVDESALLDMRVSLILELHEGALDVLIRHGFTPLAQTHLRALLAPTVTLRQALRIRSMSADVERELLDELLVVTSHAHEVPPLASTVTTDGRPR